MPTDTSTPATPPHEWIPPGGGVNWTRVGDLGWHALTLPTYLGNRVLAHLGDGSGAVIQEDIGREMTWLIAPHAPAVQHLRADDRFTLAGDDGSFLFVPGMTRDHLVWWRIAPEPDRLLTPAARLADAIATTLQRTTPRHRTPGGAAR
ncbi:hypothetical protein [Streptomyces zagrosensis]|uniref:Uncharacterized protein n=1 Tax=Streptomyces zagrosensis TaxID=1042984 RepID=A0A7W9UWD3_9ACTN|nr:hypothetical protein [Streptomyces zagrosensis]MBB5933196.1 hypothetical protein [Streptomyces zagrosensis]